MLISAGGGRATSSAATRPFAGTFRNEVLVNLESLQLGFTTRVLLFAAAASLFTALLSGLMPALLGSRVEVLSGLKASATDLTRGRSFARGTLVALQIAISLILIVGAALFIRSLQIALATDVGVDAKRLAYADVSFSAAGYERTAIAGFYDAILIQLGGMPNVEGVTVGGLPLASIIGSNQLFNVDGVERTMANTVLFQCGPDYFKTTGIQMSSGRVFVAEDRQGSPPVVIVNEAFARRVWGADCHSLQQGTIWRSSEWPGTASIATSARKDGSACISR